MTLSNFAMLCVAVLLVAQVPSHAHNHHRPNKGNNDNKHDAHNHPEPQHHGRHDDSSSSSSSSSSGCDADKIRLIIQQELAAYNLTRVPTNATDNTFNNNKTSISPQTFRLTDDEGREFDYTPDDGTYRADIPSTMCTASELSSATPSNQQTFVNAHNTLRGQLNNCKWKLPKPLPLLSGCVKSSVMAQQANQWTQNLKNTNACNMQHSTQATRTQTFQLDNGTQVTNGYIGENLAWRSLCLTTTDTNNYNKYRSQYCTNGYLYNQSSYDWWSEVKSYSNANGGNFVSSSQLNQLNSNSQTQVGHWTQMAWANSDVIAGAAAECTTVGPQTFTCWPAGVGGCGADGKMVINSRCFSWIITGRYYKGGNWVGQNPYTSSGTLCNPPASG